MKQAYTRLLTDQELRSHLQAGEAVAFLGVAESWKNIERQVESLGFGASYAVSLARKGAGDPGLIRVSPMNPAIVLKTTIE